MSACQLEIGPTVRDFRALQVWQKAHQLTLSVYKATSEFPGDERFGLTSQIRRAASSIPSNIAEGCGRGSESELSHFMQIAMGSSSELEYQILLAKDLEFVLEDDFIRLEADLLEVKKMLSRFIVSLRPRH
jgi:four helix bundle protein